MKVQELLSRSIATILVGAIIITAPGLDCYRAAAGGFDEAPVVAPAPETAVTPALGAQATLPAQTLPAGTPLALPQQSVALPAVNVALPANPAAPAAALQSLPSSSEQDAEAPAAATLQSVSGRTAELDGALGSVDATPERVHDAASWNGSAQKEAADVVAAAAQDNAPSSQAPIAAQAASSRRPLASAVPMPSRPQQSEPGGLWSRLMDKVFGPASMPAANGVVGDNAGPSYSQRLASHLAATVAPGASMNVTELAQSALKAVPQPEIANSVNALTKEHKLIVINGKQYLLAIPAENVQPAGRAGLAFLKQGIASYDSQDAASLAIALTSLDKAVMAFAQAAYDPASVKNVALARALRANASAALFSRLLSIKKASAPEAKAWLDGAYFSSNRDAAAPNAQTLSMLRSTLAREIPPASMPNPDIRAGAEVMSRFFEQMQLVAASAAPQAARKSSEDADEEQPAKTDSAAAKKEIPGLKGLSKFGVNLTELAQQGRLTPLIGRERELDEVATTLAQWQGNSPVLIGEAGVGKTQIVDGLAQRAVDGKLPFLKDKVIFRINTASLEAGTKLRGQFEENILEVLKVAEGSEGRLILFIDEIHRLMGLGDREGGNDAANMFKEALARGTLTVIGATTFDEYRKIEKDKAMARRFMPVRVLPPDRDDTVQILEGLAPAMARHNQVRIPVETIRAAVEMSGKYLTDRRWPDSAVRLLARAAAYTQLHTVPTGAPAPGVKMELPEVSVENLARVVSEWTGIPAAKLTQSDRETLKNLEAEMQKRVIDQDEAVSAVARSIRRNRLGYSEAGKPIGKFLFLGPTGVGKTEVARVLAQQYYHNPDSFIRLDMSEYSDEIQASRLIGAPPAYVGYKEGGQLTNLVKKHPYSVILFDEVEKAHESVLNKLLQIMEEGTLTDSQGTAVDFSNTIIIMTSNVGASEMTEVKKRPIGFAFGEADAAAPAGVKGAAMAAAKAHFRPELLNRLDEIVVFNRLSREDVAKVLDIQMGDMNKTLAAKDLSVTLTPAAREFLIAKGFDPLYGARPMKRAIQHELKDLLVDAELEGRIKSGDAVVADVKADGSGLVLTAAKKGGGGLSANGALKAGLLGLGGLLLVPHASFAAAAAPAAAVAATGSLMPVLPLALGAGLIAASALYRFLKPGEAGFLSLVPSVSERSSWKSRLAPIMGSAAGAAVLIPALNIMGADAGLAAWGAYAAAYGALLSILTLITQGRPAAAVSNLAFGWDWRAKLRALRLASLLGLKLTTPALSHTQWNAFLKHDENFPPKLLIFDFDGTLQANNGPKAGTPLSPEMALALEQAQKAGMTIAVATDRPFEAPEAQTEEDPSIARLLMEQLKPEVRRHMLVAVNGGAEIYQYNGKGDKPKAPILSAPPFSGAEKEAMSAAIRKAMADLGVEAGDIKSVPSDHKIVLVLESKEQRKKVEALGAKIRKNLAAAGLSYPLQVRYPHDPVLAPYLVIRKADKSNSVEGILKVLSEQGEYVDPNGADVRMFGDETDRGGLDLTMAKALPQAELVSVGARLDPSVPNAIRSPIPGPAGVSSYLKAVAGRYVEQNPEHVFSYSQINLRLHSPREFQERYGRGRQAGGEGRKDPLPAFVGSRAHEVMHWLYAQGIAGRDLTKSGQQKDLVETAKQVYDSRWKQSWDPERVDVDAAPLGGWPEKLKGMAETPRDKRIASYREHGWEFIQRYIGKYMPFNQDKTIAMERPIMGRIRGAARSFLFKIIPDRVALTRDGYLEIHDYKTGYTPTQDELKSDFKQHFQLFLYALIIRKAWPEYAGLKVRLVWHFTDTDLVLEPTAQELDASELQISVQCEKMLQDLDASESDPALSFVDMKSNVVGGLA